MSRAETIRWRPATLSDARLLLRWRNDRLARKNSGNQRAVGLASHTQWLEGVLANPRAGLWIAQNRAGKPVGQLRVTVSRGIGTVSISVAADQRGKGWGTTMLKRIPSKVKKLRALVKTDNVASVIAFVKAGFVFSQRARCGGDPAYEFERHG